MELAAVPPNVTPVTSASRDPAIVTVVPPASGPDEGVTDVTTGTPTTSAFTSSSSFEIWLVGERVVPPSASTGELKKPKVELAGAVLEKGTGAPVGNRPRRCRQCGSAAEW